MTKSTFFVVEDDVSIGLFASRSNRLLFNEILEVRNFEKDKSSNVYTNELIVHIQMLTETLDEVAATQ